MQIIQGIRDKGAVIFSLVIAIALIGFILMSAEKGNSSRLFGSSSTSVGKINGNSIDLNDFNAAVNQQSDKEARQTGQQPTGVALERIREQVWNQLVAENVFYKEADKLGITLTAKELSAILTSNDPNNPLLQEKSLQDSTGKLDPEKVREAIANIKKFKGEQRNRVDSQIIDPLRLSTAAAKYSGLINAGSYYPSWMKTRDEVNAKTFAVINYSGVAYNEISDSAVKVTDDDINNYVAKRKDLFKQEAGRSISYLAFSQSPSKDDSDATKKMLSDLRSQFEADTNAKAFVARNTSAVDFTDDFQPLSKINSSAKDSIAKISTNAVYGPYADNGNFVLAKLLGSKQLPDSVKARHILIGVNNPQTGQPIRSDSAAKKIADSVLAAVKAGADFGALALKYSDDKGSAVKGGDLGTFGYGTMVPEFNSFVFSKATGDKDVVKTQFGYHVIDIVKQSDFKPAYKIAFLAKPILPSDETINASSLAATKASQNKTGKELADYAAKNGLKLVDVPATVKENDYSAGSLQDARALVRWAFGAGKGDVSEPLAVGDQFIVATVNKIYEKGTQDAATARAGAEAAVRNQKKAEMIQAKIGANPTPESVATAYNKAVQTAGADSSITMEAHIINGIGQEPKVIGASFNKDFQSKSSGAIVGTTGVYVIKVNSYGEKTITPEAAAAAEKARINSLRQASANWFQPLKDQADISDKRAKYF